ncbi:MAG TPA: diguanylate cyclase, partial [Miltoncostaeaceae bacterium]|nr:diguanylate cyclase [Miltoncostaeaceae bacterium]
VPSPASPLDSAAAGTPAWRAAARRVGVLSALQLAVVLATAVAVLAAAALLGTRLMDAESSRDERGALARQVMLVRAELQDLGRTPAPATAAQDAAWRLRAAAVRGRVRALAAHSATLDADVAATGRAAAARVDAATRGPAAGGGAVRDADPALNLWLAAAHRAQGRSVAQKIAGVTVWATAGLVALTLLVALTGTLAWALLNRARARLTGAIERALAEQAALYRTATAVASGAGLDATLDRVAGEAVRLLGCERALVVRFLPGGTGEVAGAAGEGGRSDRPVALTGDGVVARVHRQGAPAATSPDADGPDGRPALAAPVPLDGAPWGAIACFAGHGHRFAPDDAAMLARFGLLAGMAVADAAGRRALEAQASSDGLTGLANHRSFRERLAAEAERARRHGRELALVLLDVDHFREVNTALGHRGGDRLLRDLAGLLEASARTGDTVARIGGQEFAWLMPECDSYGAWTAAERLRARAAAGPLGGLTGQTVSAGVCDLAQADGTADRLFELSSGALYWAKQHGRDLCVRYSPDVVVDLSATERAARLERARALDAVRLLAQAVDARDPSTQRHSERVAALAAELARVMGWDADRVRRLYEAALVHDVGKIGIADSVLLKDGPLTPEERRRIEAHSALGAQMVTDVLSAEQVAWVRGHHERWDGGGYPDGLAGDAIPDGARILIVADAVDAMTSVRPYRPGRPHAEAHDEVVACSGAQFPPDVVAAFARIYRSGRLAEVLASATAEP